jgi:hypothetical protein
MDRITAWYGPFNILEGVLWLMVAGWIGWRVPVAGGRQRRAVWLGMLAFAVFGVTDFLEARAGSIPAWLWGLKSGCCLMALVARYEYKGWDRFRTSDREFRFGLVLGAGALLTISLQFGWIDMSAGFAWIERWWP